MSKPCETGRALYAMEDALEENRQVTMGGGEEDGVNRLDWLPDELQVGVLSQLDLAALVCCRLVCKHLNALADSPVIWHSLCVRYAGCPLPFDLGYPMPVDLWRELFKALYRRARGGEGLELLHVLGVYTDGGCDENELRRYWVGNMFDVELHYSYVSQAPRNIHCAAYILSDSRVADSPAVAIRRFILGRLRLSVPLATQTSLHPPDLPTERLVRFYSQVWAVMLAHDEPRFRELLLLPDEQDTTGPGYRAAIETFQHLHARYHEMLPQLGRWRAKGEKILADNDLVLRAALPSLSALGDPRPALVGWTLTTIRRITVRRPRTFTCPVRTGAFLFSFDPIFDGGVPTVRHGWKACDPFDDLTDVAVLPTRAGVPPIHSHTARPSFQYVEFKRAGDGRELQAAVWFQFGGIGSAPEDGELFESVIELRQPWVARFVIVKLVDCENRMAELGDTHADPNVDAGCFSFEGFRVHIDPPVSEQHGTPVLVKQDP